MLQLETLTPEDITRLLAASGKRRVPRAKKYGLIVEAAGITVIPNPTASQKGGFSGTVGTKRRSRKGRTWTMPNGQRYYEGLDQLDAYKV